MPASRFPLPAPTPWARNQWYVAAWSAELGERALGRRLLGQTLALFRDENGVARAIPGLCPHRRAPLADGAVVAGTVVCPYHGARFNGGGQCVSLPFQDRVPPGMHLLPVPVAERGGLVWIWSGDREQPDHARLPDTNGVGLGPSGWRFDPAAPVLVRARAGLLIDNLFDSSHIGFTHPDSLGACPLTTARQKPATVQRDDYLAFLHQGTVRPMDRALRTLYRDNSDHVATRMRYELLGVGLINAVGSASFACAADGTEMHPVGTMNFLHAITPAGIDTTHYFSAMTRNFAADDDGLSRMLAERNSMVVTEDIAMVESIERHLDGDEHPAGAVDFAVDAQALKVRKHVGQLLQA